MFMPLKYRKFSSKDVIDNLLIWWGHNVQCQVGLIPPIPMEIILSQTNLLSIPNYLSLPFELHAMDHLRTTLHRGRHAAVY